LLGSIAVFYVVLVGRMSLEIWKALDGGN
jgi:hypothetical protein